MTNITGASEFFALEEMLKILSPFAPKDQDRMIRWLCDRLNSDNTAKRKGAEK